jgi:hypothetical protein
MKGRRVHPAPGGSLALAPGEYLKTEDGDWWASPPLGGVILIESKDVSEHPDGTITVNRPISKQGWSGRLIQGEWQAD